MLSFASDGMHAIGASLPCWVAGSSTRIKVAVEQKSYIEARTPPCILKPREAGVVQPTRCQEACPHHPGGVIHSHHCHQRLLKDINPVGKSRSARPFGLWLSAGLWPNLTLTELLIFSADPFRFSSLFKFTILLDVRFFHPFQSLLQSLQVSSKLLEAGNLKKERLRLVV